MAARNANPSMRRSYEKIGDCGQSVVLTVLIILLISLFILLLLLSIYSFIYVFTKVKYTGTKHYNSSFLDIGEQDPDEATNSVVQNLVPGTRYNFEVNSVSVCGESQPTAAEVTTKMSGKQTVD